LNKPNEEGGGQRQGGKAGKLNKNGTGMGMTGHS